MLIVGECALSRSSHKRSLWRMVVDSSNQRVFRALRHEHTICVQVFSEILRERADDCAFDTVL